MPPRPLPRCRASRPSGPMPRAALGPPHSSRTIPGANPTAPHRDMDGGHRVATRALVAERFRRRATRHRVHRTRSIEWRSRGRLGRPRRHRKHWWLCMRLSSYAGLRVGDSACTPRTRTRARAAAKNGMSRQYGQPNGAPLRVSAPDDSAACIEKSAERRARLSDQRPIPQNPKPPIARLAKTVHTQSRTIEPMHHWRAIP
jgi:hypothetical protein